MKKDIFYYKITWEREVNPIFSLKIPKFETAEDIIKFVKKIRKELSNITIRKSRTGKRFGKRQFVTWEQLIKILKEK